VQHLRLGSNLELSTKMNPFNYLRKLAGAAVKKNGLGLQRWLLKSSCVDHIDGIAICDLSTSQGLQDDFLDLTRQAMALIKSLDARRYSRICRHFDYIVNTDLVLGGSFNQRLKICNVDFKKYVASAHPQGNIRAYARLLVHEATHGLIFEKGIPYDKETRERVERLCHREEYRFALLFGSEYADTRPGPFNEALYKWHWENSQKMKLSIRKKRLSKALSALTLPIGRPAPRQSEKLNGNQEMAGDSIGVIQFNSQDEQRYNERGITYLRKRAYNLAVADFDAAIQLNSQSALAYANRGHAYHCQGKYDKALADYDRAIQLDEHLSSAFVNRGFTNNSIGKYERALADYTRAIQLNPKDASAYKHLAWLLSTCREGIFRDGERALKAAIRSCELSGWKDSFAMETLAAAFAEAGDFVNAINWQSQYLKTPNLSSSNVVRAQRRLALYEARKPYHSLS
jgi:tetratricopeptide (TPR) repeat protein